MSNSYWIDRLVKTQNAIADKTIEDIQRQLKKYYKDAMEQVISDFEATYDKLLATIEDGREPTPADLYKLDKYWQMQAQLKNEMQALGDKEIALLSEKFEKEWNDIYESFALTSKNSFSTISTRNAKAAINTAWLSDGKNFSQRVWNNTDKLVETLNDNLINCVITGKKTTELKQLLQKRFNVSYNAADMLVRTETAHIQTQAAAQRYKDYGLKEYEFLADPDERTCSVCAALDGKRFLLSEMKPGVNAPPMHPRDRCCIVPVVNKETEEKIMEKDKKEFRHICNVCNREFKTNNENDTICNNCLNKIENDLRNLKKLGTPKENLDKFEEAWKIGAGGPKVKDLTMYNRRCSKCGAYTTAFYKNGTVLCDSCRWEMENELAVCTVCGDIFSRKKQGKNKTMCDDCYREYRKKYKAEKEKERRKKKKYNG